jgi:hypothetical protein
MSNENKPAPPTCRDLRDTLGSSHSVLESFLSHNDDLRPEWKYYGAKHGWSLKLFHGKRNLCFISPHDGHWSIGFVLGDRAVDAVLRSDLPDPLKQQLRDARRYAEGRGLRLTIRSDPDLDPAQTLLDLKQTH